MQAFDIPVVLFMFRRADTLLKIVDRVREVKPKKMYLLSDNGRNAQEKKQVADCRRKVEDAIDWSCTIIKDYANENRGVHANIGLGAKWIFEREKWAIFLEDDNLPEVSFFEYCRELLMKYEGDYRVLWICGTNYLGNYSPKNGASYMFTRHLLPCGWASWSDKFIKFYDAELNLAYDNYIMENCRRSYEDERLYWQQYESIMREKHRKDRGHRFASWDYHMALSIRANGLLGISPAKNQIRNIGVDQFSIHGGTTLSNIMTRRFCGMESYTLKTPLEHPKTVLVDTEYEKKITKIILLPLQLRMKMKIVHCIKRLLLIPNEESLSETVRNRFMRAKERINK